ncbi:hypothetical protein FRX31_024647 [Thalictrum thalictroides]|uniref:Uncharacterized protein n=1 Tax=Thalictrum thalictroides TaxID=46969 RepID=A0A7J6VKV8_THATH|nr:hypothetical protein FRX31_024647 [Thalictrum thalictroides]
MEKNKSNKDGKAIKTRFRKLKDRLQKQAPANLLIDSSTSSGPIPLLSPIILSPNSLPDTDDKGALDKDQAGRNNNKAALTTSNGPASSSSIFASFKSQCMLAHHPQFGSFL